MDALFSLSLPKDFKSVSFKTNVLQCIIIKICCLMEITGGFFFNPSPPKPIPRVMLSNIHPSCKDLGCGEYTQASQGISTWCSWYSVSPVTPFLFKGELYTLVSQAYFRHSIKEGLADFRKQVERNKLVQSLPQSEVQSFGMLSSFRDGLMRSVGKMELFSIRSVLWCSKVLVGWSCKPILILLIAI